MSARPSAPVIARVSHMLTPTLALRPTRQGAWFGQGTLLIQGRPSTTVITFTFGLQVRVVFF